MTLHPNGLGASLGDDLVTGKPLQTASSVFYVHSGTGDDTNSGSSRSAPKATLASAEAAASPDDIIVLMDGHAETITTRVVLNSGNILVGEGSSGGKPTVKLTNNQSNGHIIWMDNDVEIRNIWFEEESQANAAATLSTDAADRVGIIGCYFECNGNTTAGLKIISSNDVRVENCTFVSTSTDDASRPTYGLWASNGGSRLFLHGTTFDNGEVGFSSGACHASAGSWGSVRGLNVSLLRGAEMLFEGTSTGWLVPSTTTGNAYISGLD